MRLGFRKSVFHGIKGALLISSLLSPLINTSASAQEADEHATKKEQVSTALIAKIGNTRNRVLVSIGVDRGGATVPGENYTERKARYNRAQQQVLSSLPAGTYTEKRRFGLIPFMSLWVDAHALRAIAANPNVTSLAEIVPEPPLLSTSTVLIGAQDAWAMGANGAGQSVAVLDTGIQSDHPFLNGKVVSEACYSTIYGSVTSGCPNGATSQVGAGAGAPLPDNVSRYYHGTHVAGIAAGGWGSSPSGVAPGATLISIQVFSIETSSTTCASWGTTTPCALSYADDQVAALEHIYELSGQFSIASANMSLGGGGYTDYCDSSEALRKSAIDVLRGIDVATVIASGNNGYTDKVSAPACISSAVSVGATTKSDTVETYSNSASILDLLAPGGSIYSSLPPSSYGYKWGTSMAAPHVAGAFAVLKEAHPYKTVNDLESALKATGSLIVDLKNGLAKPRINMDEAYRSLTSAFSYSGTHKLPTNIYNNANTSATQGQFVDVNGDGELDWVLAYQGEVSYRATYISSGSGWQADPSYDLPTNIYISGNNAQGQFVDVNGDGYLDWVLAYQGATSYRKTYISTPGSSCTTRSCKWVESASWKLPTNIYNYYNTAATQGQFVDVNGDGLPDWVLAYQGALSYRATYINTGSGWQADSTYDLPTNIYWSANNAQGQFVDVNGDGIRDWVEAYQGADSYRVTYVSTPGNSCATRSCKWVQNAAWRLPTNIYNYYNTNATQGQFVDVNSDGLLDWILAYQGGVSYRTTYLNTGSGWQANDLYDLPTNIYWTGNKLQGQFVDVNGDGIRDWVEAYQGATSYRKTYISTPGRSCTTRSCKWVEDVAFQLPTNIYDGEGRAQGQFVDVNRDGWLDWVLAYQGAVSYRTTYLNLGAP